MEGVTSERALEEQEERHGRTEGEERTGLDRQGMYKVSEGRKRLSVFFQTSGKLDPESEPHTGPWSHLIANGSL